MNILMIHSPICHFAVENPMRLKCKTVDKTLSLCSVSRNVNGQWEQQQITIFELNHHTPSKQ